MKRKAFTLTELLIALAVLGLLIAVLTPVISNLIPDQNALMAKRSYYAAQTLVSELINDEACYPDMTLANFFNPETGQYDQSGRRVGFDDGFGYPDCYLWGGSGDDGDHINGNESRLEKFTTLFKSKLDIREERANGAFLTRDGTLWVITADDATFPANDRDGYLTITVDVNGDENPGCAESDRASGVLHDANRCGGRVDGFDVYSVRVFADGRMEINDDWAKEAVDINKDVTNIEDDEPAGNNNQNNNGD